MVGIATIAIGLTALLWLIDYLTEGKLHLCRSETREKFVSFVAGLSVTYIFLHLFPLVYSGAEYLPRLTFLSMLAGFVVYHLVEKWIYQHAPREELGKEIEKEHAITLFIYQFSIGIVFISLIRTSIVDGLLYFIPVSLHVIISSLPHSHHFQKRSVKAFFTSAPFLGSLFALLVAIPDIVNVGLLGLVAGLLLFLEFREVISRKRKGSPLFFLVGAVLYGLLIIGSGAL
jgi:hypothetical protein